MTSGEADGSKRTVIASGVLTTLTTLTTIAEAITATISGVADITHLNYPFPPGYESTHGTVTAKADGWTGNVINTTLSATADYYMADFNVKLISASEFMTSHLHGFMIELIINSDTYAFRKSYRGSQYGPTFFTGGSYYTMVYEGFKTPIKIPAGETIGLYLWNHTGQTLTTIAGKIGAFTAT